MIDIAKESRRIIQSVIKRNRQDAIRNVRIVRREGASSDNARIARNNKNKY